MLALSLLKENGTETRSSDSDSWMTGAFQCIALLVVFVRATGNFHWETGLISLPHNCKPPKKLQVNRPPASA